MKSIRLVPVATQVIGVERRLIDAAANALTREMGVRCTVADTVLDATPVHHPERNQYHSTPLLDHLERMAPADGIALGIAELDLYIPILTFVFGEAHLGGKAAVVSYHRLTQEFYGLPPDRRLLTERLMKEAVHEAGHAAGLTHCEDYECVMAASHAVEWLDLKSVALCAECKSAFAEMARSTYSAR